MRIRRPVQQFARPANRRGLSLVEVVISTLLVGFLAVGAMAAVGGVFRTWQASAREFDAAALTQHLMTEILQAHYEEPVDVPTFGRESSESGGNRSAWDDVDDYHGWSKSLPDVPEAKDGTALGNYTGWARAVIVEFVNPANPQTVIGTDQGLKRITVTVTDPEGKQTTLAAFRSRWGALEQLPVVDTTVETWVGGELQIGSDTTATVTATNLVNHAKDQ